MLRGAFMARCSASVVFIKMRGKQLFLKLSGGEICSLVMNLFTVSVGKLLIFRAEKTGRTNTKGLTASTGAV